MSEYVYQRYRGAFAKALASALGKSAAEIEPSIKAAEPVHGDFAFPTFSLAKVQKKAPNAIATSLAQSLSVPGMEVVAAGPYVNARLLATPLPARFSSRCARWASATAPATRAPAGPW